MKRIITFIIVAAAVFSGSLHTIQLIQKKIFLLMLLSLLNPAYREHAKSVQWRLQQIPDRIYPL